MVCQEPYKGLAHCSVSGLRFSTLKSLEPHFWCYVFSGSDYVSLLNSAGLVWTTGHYVFVMMCLSLLEGVSSVST